VTFLCTACDIVMSVHEFYVHNFAKNADSLKKKLAGLHEKVVNRKC